jgi:hypothetical protein
MSFQIKWIVHVSTSTTLIWCSMKRNFGEQRHYRVDHLRHSKFVGIREEKNPRSVIKEEVG